MNIIRYLSLIGMLITATATHAATDDNADAKISAADEITDLLGARWFEIELIIFERLDVLDTNTPESLMLRAPRAWPANLLQLDKPLQAERKIRDTDFRSGSSAPLDFTQASPYCFGYPMFAEEDPLHPLLDPQRRNNFGDSVKDNVARAERNADPGTGGIDPLLAAAGDNASAGSISAPLNSPKLAPTAAQLLLVDIQQFESDLYANSYRTLDATSMDSDVKSINRQRSLRPLIHLRWRQPVPERSNPQPIHISAAIDAASPASALGMAKVEGFVEVTVGRYLHFAPTLWYHADNLGLDPIALPMWIDGQDFPSAQLSDPDPSTYMQLKESRRLRSGNLHYIDHPKMGVIVQIDPITIPPALEEALSQLNGTQRESVD